MSMINNVADVVMSGGRHVGKSMGELGSTYIGYCYLQWLASEGNANAIEYLLEHPIRTTPSWEECKSYVLPFGKHKGSCVMDLACTFEGRSYLQYLSGWEKMQEREVIKRVVAAFPNMPPAMLQTDDYQKWSMPFGKYKGKKMMEVGRKDARYVMYLIEQMQKKPSHQNAFLMERLKFVLNQ